MICEKCGIVYEGNFCPNGCNNPMVVKKAKKPIYKKWWFWLIIGIVVVSIASSGGNDTTAATDTPKTTESNVATQAATTTTEDPYYHAGDVIDANGLRITYVKAEKHKEKNQFLQPKDGYMYVKLYLSVENTADTDRYISSFEFNCYADGKKQEALYTSDEALEGGELSSGRADEGYIYFSVPKDAKDIEVEYETSFWTDKKAILKVELG